MDGRQKLKELAVSESGFLFDPYTGSSFSTNESGRCILEGLREGLGRKGLVARLQERFGLADNDVERDLDEFLFMLRESGVLPTDFQPEA